MTPKTLMYPLGLSLSALLAPAAAAQAPTLALGKPIASPATEFTKISSLIEMPGGRVLVVDSDENRLVLLEADLAGGRPIGRRGGGPGEFNMIERALPRAEGGAWVIDFMQRRLLPVADDGSFLAPVLFPSGQWLGGDAQGRLYGTAFFRRTGAGMSDSSHLVRWDRKSGRVDTVAAFNAGNSKHLVMPGARRQGFAALDAWIATPTGDLLVLEAATYRLLTLRDGRRVASVDVAWTPEKVTQADKDRFIRETEAQRPRAMGSSKALDDNDAIPKVVVSGYDFPATLPAFDNMMGDAVTLSPAGHLWVTRLGHLNDPIPRYDVVGLDGKLRGQVTLPARSRIAGFGKGAVYLVERDGDDIERVRKYGYPAVR